MKKRTPIITAGPAGAFALVACLALAGPALAQGNVDRGAQLAEQWCNSCHTVGSSSDARQSDPGPMFAELARKGEGYLMRAMNRPHDFMPKFPKLSPQDKQALIAYIRTVK